MPGGKTISEGQFQSELLSAIDDDREMQMAVCCFPAPRDGRVMSTAEEALQAKLSDTRAPVQVLLRGAMVERPSPLSLESLLGAPGGIQAPSMTPLKPGLEHVPGDGVAELLTDIARGAEMNARDDAGVLDLFQGR